MKRNACRAWLGADVVQAPKGMIAMSGDWRRRRREDRLLPRRRLHLVLLRLRLLLRRRLRSPSKVACLTFGLLTGAAPRRRGVTNGRPTAHGAH